MKIQYLVMDVDGTLTDGKVYIGNNGEEFKAFDIKDGCGIHDLLPDEIVPVIITGRVSKIVEKRCAELGIKEMYQGISDKFGTLQAVLQKSGSGFANVAYIGDDINDLQCMNAVKSDGGIVGCPCDAVGKVQTIADYVCKKGGGRGAVREFIEWLVSTYK